MLGPTRIGSMLMRQKPQVVRTIGMQDRGSNRRLLACQNAGPVRRRLPGCSQIMAFSSKSDRESQTLSSNLQSLIDFLRSIPSDDIEPYVDTVREKLGEYLLISLIDKQYI